MSVEAGQQHLLRKQMTFPSDLMEQTKERQIRITGK